MWGYLYGQAFGPIAQIARALGLTPPQFLTRRTIIPALANIATWQYTGYNMLILFAALKAIPPELYEAARVDGASGLQIALRDPDPADRPGHGPDLHLLDHRDAPAVHRAAASSIRDRPDGHRAELHAQPVRLQPGLPESPVRLLGGDRLQPRPDHGRAIVPGPVRRLPASVPPGRRSDGRRAPAIGRFRTTGRRASSLGDVFMLVGLVYFLVPLVWLFLASTKSNSGLFQSFGFWFDKDFNLIQNLEDLLARDNGAFVDLDAEHVIYAFVAAVGSTLISALAGYAFAVYRFRGRGVLFAHRARLGVRAGDDPGGAALLPARPERPVEHPPGDHPAGALVNPFGVFLMRIFAERAIPEELLDAARVDGAGELRIFATIALAAPRAGPRHGPALRRSSAPGTTSSCRCSSCSDADVYPVTVGLANWNALADAARAASGALRDRRHGLRRGDPAGDGRVPVPPALLAAGPEPGQRHAADGLAPLHRAEQVAIQERVPELPLGSWRSTQLQERRQPLVGRPDGLGRHREQLAPVGTRLERGQRRLDARAGPGGPRPSRAAR